MIKNMLMMGKELHRKKEMYAVNAYVMYWGSDFIPSDAHSEEMCCKGADLAMFGSSICWSMKSRQWIKYFQAADIKQADFKFSK